MQCNRLENKLVSTDDENERHINVVHIKSFSFNSIRSVGMTNKKHTVGKMSKNRVHK